MSIKDRALDIFSSGIGPATDLVSSVFLTGVAGQIVPGVVSTMLAYQQKRSERMYEQFMLDIKGRQEALEEKLQRLSDDRREWFSDVVFPLVSDHVLRCDQADKIHYLATGFIHAAAHPTMDEHKLRFYLDLLDRVNVLDLVILKSKSLSHRDGHYHEWVTEQMVMDGTVQSIHQKLKSMALLQTKGDGQYPEVMQAVADLYDYLKQKETSKHPERVKLPKLSVKTRGAQRYELTRMGLQFIHFFSDAPAR